MTRTWNRAPAMLAAAVITGVGMMLAACGDDGSAVSQHDQPAQTPAATNGGASLSSIAPDTFLTYEGKRYRLVDLQQADLVEEGSFLRVGTATETDIDQDDLTVFERNGDDGAIYTYAKEQRQSDAASTAEGADVTTPALWYRWAAD